MDFIGSWRRQPVEWTSPLEPEAAATRLRECLTGRHRGHEFAALVLRGDGKVAFAGQVSGRDFEVHTFQPGMRGSFRATLSGEIGAEPSGGCRVVGHVGYPAFTKVFVALWTSALAIAVAGALLAAGVVATNSGLNDAVPLLVFGAVATALLAFGGLIFSIGTAQGRDEQARVRAWVAETLSASDVTADYRK